MVMPKTTPVPMVLREAAPEPEASISGTQPRMKAKEVIRIGRRRSFAPSMAASMVGTPSSRFILANSMMRMAFLAARPMSMTRPTWA
jgi:hypothetical protein